MATLKQLFKDFNRSNCHCPYNFPQYYFFSSFFFFLFSFKPPCDCVTFSVAGLEGSSALAEGGAPAPGWWPSALLLWPGWIFPAWHQQGTGPAILRTDTREGPPNAGGLAGLYLQKCVVLQELIFFFSIIVSHNVYKTSTLIWFLAD